MADFTLSSGSYIRPYLHPFGSPPMRDFQESTCATTGLIKAGHVVTCDTHADTSYFRIRREGIGTTLASTCIWGVAAEASTSDGSTTGLPTLSNRRINVWLADPYTEFQCYSTGAIASTLQGTARALRYDSTLNIHLLDYGNSSRQDHRIVVTRLLASPGDTNAPVAFRFLKGPVGLDSTVSSAVSYLAGGW